MKKILLSLLLVPLMAFAQVTLIPTSKICSDREILNSALTDFEEQPLLIMSNNKVIDDQKIESHVTILFANNKTGSWTLVEQWNDNFFCVVAMGSNIKPFSSINNSREKMTFKE